MSPRIYTSAYPSAPILNTSIFTRVFAPHGPELVGAFPRSMKAFIDSESGTFITRGQLHLLALSFAYGLREHPTTQPYARRGDTALILAANSLAWPVILHGCVAAGLRCTFANRGFSFRELAYQYLDKCIDTVRSMFSEIGLSREEGDRRTIILDRDLRWAGGSGASRNLAAHGLRTFQDMLSRGTMDREEQFEGSTAHETVFLCYSSGTTGKPKGVETTHQNMTTALDVVASGFAPLRPGEDKVLGCLPFYHIVGGYLLARFCAHEVDPSAGAVQLLHLPLTLGSPVVIQSRFEPFQSCANIEKYKIVFAYIVPPILVTLARHAAVDTFDLSSLRYLRVSAAPAGSDLIKHVKNRLARRGGNCTIYQGYGQTETSTGVFNLPVDEAERKMGSVGTLSANLEVRIVLDEEGKHDAETGQRGELWVRGKTVMKGYLNNPRATSESITADGWYKTGDIVVRDPEGFYCIVDRIKELIKYKGSQVAPAELEGVLLTHPDIADAAVIGVESIEQATELPRAYIVHAYPERVRTDAQKMAFARIIQKWMETKVSRIKFLRGGVSIVDTLPKSAAGKILRRELRDLAKLQLARGEIFELAPVTARL
ncbi:AMP binding protein [Mycena rosella]|uniref:AMP binding protein n=1 Tax=Mycena rosella TaxID=1033263 RepID=A0AAD7DQT5_MYCRO|nr:AMP binding protein [Mycena rosella]